MIKNRPSGRNVLGSACSQHPLRPDDRSHEVSRPPTISAIVGFGHTAFDHGPGHIRVMIEVAQAIGVRGAAGDACIGAKEAEKDCRLALRILADLGKAGGHNAGPGVRGYA